MNRKIVLTFAALVAAGGCAQGTQVAASGDVAAATPVNRSMLPVGTTMSARFNQAIGTSNREGDTFTATITEPVYAQNGAVAVPAGATLYGHVTGVHAGSVVGDQSVIRLNFDNLQMNGRTYPFEGSISNVSVDQSNGGGTSTTKGAVTGAAAGAVLGAVLSGGDLSKIITGGLLGAAAGTVISMGTGGTQATIPSGSVVTVRATQPVQIR